MARPLDVSWIHGASDCGVLQLTKDHLLELDTTLQALGSTPVTYAFDDFILSP